MARVGAARACGGWSSCHPEVTRSTDPGGFQGCGMWKGQRHVCPDLAYRLRSDESVQCRPDRRGGSRCRARLRLRSDPHLQVAERQARLHVLFRSRRAAAGAVRVEGRERSRGRGRRDRARASGSRSPTRCFDPKAKALAYGKSTKFGKLTCTSRTYRHHVQELEVGPRLHRLRRKAAGVLSDGRRQVGLRLRRGIEGHARPARRQGRERRRDDAGAGRGSRAGRLHDHDRGLRRLHEGRPGRARRHGRPGRRRARAPAGAHRQAAGRRR